MNASSSAQSTLSDFLSKRIQELQSRKSQQEIANQAGFANANFVSMLKSGRSKLALDRVPAMAKALDVDPAYLFRLALNQFFDEEALKTLMPLFNHAISKNEAAIINEIREASGNSDPSLTFEIKDGLFDLFSK